VDKDIKPALGQIDLRKLTGRDLYRFYSFYSQLLSRGLSKATCGAGTPSSRRPSGGPSSGG